MRYYYAMNDAEIASHSYPYLFAMFAEYPRRACENLGVSGDKKDKKTTSANEDLAISMFESNRSKDEKGDDLRDMFYQARASSSKKGGGK